MASVRRRTPVSCLLLPVSWLHLWLLVATLSMLAQRWEHADAITGAVDEEAANQGLLHPPKPLPTLPTHKMV